MVAVVALTLLSFGVLSAVYILLGKLLTTYPFVNYSQNIQAHTKERVLSSVVTSKRILLVANDVTLAHLARPLQLAMYLHNAGHDVILAASPKSSRFFQKFPGRTHLLSTCDHEAFLVNVSNGSPVFSFETLKKMAQEDEELLVTYKPDVVIGDFRISLSVTARLNHIPYAAIANAYWSPDSNPHWVVPDLPIMKYIGVSGAQLLFDVIRPFAFAHHCRPMNSLRRLYNLPTFGYDIRKLYTDSDLVLFSDVPEQFGSYMPKNGIFLGPINWIPDIPFPKWWDQLDSNIPIIYVTLGSSGNGNLLPTLIQALRRTGLQILVASIEAEGIETGGNVFCADYLPGDAAAARSTLVVCNGGSPTASLALAHGVPVLGIPSNLDQYLNMHYLEQIGAAISIRRHDFTEEVILARTHRLLNEPSFRDSAQRLAKIYSQYNTSDLLCGPALHMLLSARS